MESASCDPWSNLKTLKTIACEVQQSDGNNLLHKLVLDNSYPNVPGNSRNINAILRSMSDLPAATVNALNDNGLNALHIAVMKNNLIMVQNLLSCLANIDVNATTGNSMDKNSALHLAVKFNHPSIIHELLEAKADVNLCNSFRKTPACIALIAGYLEIVKILVRNGAEIPKVKFHLLNATFQGQLLIIRCLIESGGVKVDYESEYGSWLLKVAALTGNIKTAEYFGVEVGKEDANLSTLLHMAIKIKSLQLVAFLLENLDQDTLFAFLNEKNERGKTPLHFGIEQSFIDVIFALALAGADLSLTDDLKLTPLHYAVKKNNLTAVEAIVIFGGASVDVINAKDKNQETALQYALRLNYSDIAKYLIDIGAL